MNKCLEKLKSKLTISSIFFILMVSFIGYYLSPVIYSSSNMASLPGDTFAYEYEAFWFCNNQSLTNFVNKDFFYPQGVNMANGYHMPVLLLFSCAWKNYGPIVMFNSIMVVQFLLIFLTTFLLANRYIKNILLKYSFVFLFSFSAFTLARSTVHADLLSTVWGTSLVFYCFYRLNYLNVRNVCLSFALLGIVFSSCWQNIPNLSPLILILFIESNLYFKGDFRKKFFNTLVGLFSFLFVFLPFSYPLIGSIFTNEIVKSYQSNYLYNSDLLSYLVPWEKSIYFSFFNNISLRIAASRSGTFFELYNSPDILITSIGICLVIIELIKNHLIFFRKHLVHILLVIIYTLLPLGPYLSILGTKFISLEYYEFLMVYPPFSFTRTPARIAIVLVFLLTFYSLVSIDRKLRVMKNSKVALLLYVCIFLYSFFTTTIYSDNFAIPYFEFKKMLPEKGLNLIKSSSYESVVLNVPLALGADPTQNFLQLYHKKPIFSGYVSYAAQSKNSLSFIETNPILSKLSCSDHLFPYIDFKNDIFLNNSGYFKDSESIGKRLLSHKVQFIILNKNMLMNDNCQELESMIQKYFVEPFYNVIDENSYFKVLSIDSSYFTQNKGDLTIFVKPGDSWSSVWGEIPSRWIIGTKASIAIDSTSNMKARVKGKYFYLQSNSDSKPNIYINNLGLKYNEHKKGEFDAILDLNKGMNFLVFSSDECIRPIDLKINDDLSCYSLGIREVSLERLYNDNYEKN